MFIYVWSDEDRNKLLSLGYRLVSPTKVQNRYYVFLNKKETESFSETKEIVSFAVSDTLMF